MPRRGHDAFGAAYALKCSISGLAFLLEDILSEMRGPHPIIDRIESACALLALVEGSAEALVGLCDDSTRGGDNGQAPQAPDA